MGFNKGSNASSNNAAPGTKSEGNFTRANAFLNAYYVTPTGGKYKIGAIPFYDHTPKQKQIKEWLLAEGKDEAETAVLRAERLQKFLNALTIDFIEVPDEPKLLDMPS